MWSPERNTLRPIFVALALTAALAADLRQEGAFSPALFDRFQQLLADYRSGAGK